ncbi:winged helix DNA-binding protein [Conexibacter sp. W3-3-2]|jgi:DNA-binding PadR family transcriptional regulator|uniref:PadR family transcriptional regulator n=1 Tax=Conexibacter sp. W3-3-2 TaxID=2675227 RepID=UPI0012B781B1|nr:PadR family transcriptional regulator [Conexibacter sp. W3-3-2]MTD46689.1 winged helix DNA-binding protein [Conexibacter sp. W3-3-2]
MDLTPAELTILGLLVEQPRHGYDLEQVIEQRGIRRWTDIGFSSIYYVLAKLEKAGLIHGDSDRPGAKSRRVFKATPEGVEVATNETCAFIASLRVLPHPILVGLANLTLIGDDDYTTALQSRLTQLESRLSAVRAAEQSQAPLPLPAREVFSYTLNHLEAEKAWITERIGVAHA